MSSVSIKDVFNVAIEFGSVMKMPSHQEHTCDALKLSIDSSIHFGTVHLCVGIINNISFTLKLSIMEGFFWLLSAVYEYFPVEELLCGSCTVLR